MRSRLRSHYARAFGVENDVDPVAVDEVRKRRRGRAALEHEGAVALARAHQTVVVAGRGRGHQADFSKTPLRAGLKVAR